MKKITYEMNIFDKDYNEIDFITISSNNEINEIKIRSIISFLTNWDIIEIHEYHDNDIHDEYILHRNEI